MSSQTALPAHFRRTMSAGRTRPVVAHRRPEHSVAIVVLHFCGQAFHAVPAGLPWLFRPKNTAFCTLARIRKGRTIRTATRGSRPAKDKAALFRSFCTKAARPLPCRSVLPLARLVRWEEPVASPFHLQAWKALFSRTGRLLPEASGGCRQTERHTDRPHEPFHTSFA